MGVCYDCYYFEKGGAFIADGRCHYLDKGVSSSGSCDHFLPRPTKSNSGYKSGDCFFTSACVDYLGKPDDCEELTVLRNFRDGYMKQSEEGKALINEYYRIAPQIVANIDASAEKNECYADIYNTILECVALIKSNENEKALENYKKMVFDYKIKYL